MDDLEQFLDPVDLYRLRGDVDFFDKHYGTSIQVYFESFPNLESVDIILVGVNEYRGAGFFSDLHPADSVREKFYKLFCWHTDVRIADIGNIKTGASLNDTVSCLKTVLKDFSATDKTIVIIGGSHDMTLAQSMVYKDSGQMVNATVIDACIDLQTASMNRSESFLMDMLTLEPNSIRHYNHIGFQSYFVHPNMLETMERLRFDCFRVGTCREQLEEMEPVMRGSSFISFDLSAIRYSDAPAGGISPNGFTGEEACRLANFAGQSEMAESFGIFGYEPEKDIHGMTALQIAQMIWYYIDGVNRKKGEASFSDAHNFNEYHTTLTGDDVTVFLQSKRTGRWWIQLPGDKYIACSHNDYIYASKNEIPERWLRAQEREF